MEYEIREERLTAGEYIDFLKRRGLGSQYPKGRFAQRIETLVKSVPISLTARGGGGPCSNWGVLWAYGFCLLAVFDRFGHCAGVRGNGDWEGAGVEGAGTGRGRGKYYYVHLPQ